MLTNALLNIWFSVQQKQQQQQHQMQENTFLLHAHSQHNQYLLS